ncbi:hypothetical protein [Methanobacterium alcaliphilum]|uniref:hypothetical protein n=1 Tax=Methanobacterium alcaliphilum TaxID=392018 RepID=UPI00200B3536|nr:hypothetical protein [Methanobacterium alcaliphilum]MCK9152426.1 hypothetical protein [Methanobacterium alcaliphilum]
MGNYSAGTAIFISVILGVILSLFLDGIFTLFVIGFIATYITNIEDQNYLIGVIAALTLEMIIFIYGLFNVPDLPYTLPANLDLFNSALGFVILCGVSILLGGLGGYLATTVSKYKIRD